MLAFLIVTLCASIGAAVLFGLRSAQLSKEQKSQALSAAQAQSQLAEHAKTVDQQNEATKAEYAKLLEAQRQLTHRYTDLSQEYAAQTEKLKAIGNLDAEKTRILRQLESQKTDLQAQIARIRVGAETAVRTFESQKQVAAESFAKEQQRYALELQSKRDLGEAEIRDLTSKIELLHSALAKLDETQILQSFGFYKPHYDFADSKSYQDRLDEIRERQKRMISDKTAAVCPVEWEVNGSRVEGRKQINQTLKLLLRAFNGESDAAIAKVRYNNLKVMEARIRKAHEAINAAGTVQQCEIASLYLALKVEELFLVHGYAEKVQEEREEQRLVRDQIREEELAQRERARQLAEAEKEERRYQEALAKARAEAAQAVGAQHQKLQGQIEELQRRLSEAQTNKERAIAQAQLTRLGHVYVISNIGSFGEGVYKIGMTRRLEPLDRVRELGDASVPFLFDVHAMIESDNAPALEHALHLAFRDRRVNMMSDRREFFRVSLDEIARFVKEHHQGEFKLTRAPQAQQYRETLVVLQNTNVHERLGHT